MTFAILNKYVGEYWTTNGQRATFDTAQAARDHIKATFDIDGQECDADEAHVCSHEIRPCTMDEDHNVEECSPEQAQFWGLYRRAADEPRTAQWLADFPTQQQAQAALQTLEARK